MRIPSGRIVTAPFLFLLFFVNSYSQQLAISPHDPDTVKVRVTSETPKPLSLEASTNFQLWNLVASTNGNLLEYIDPIVDQPTRRFFRASTPSPTNTASLQIISPLNDAVVTTNRPTIEVAFSGFSAHPTNLVLRRMGTNLPTRLNISNNRAVFELLAPLPEGFVTVYAARLDTNILAETIAGVDLNIRT